MTGHVHVAFRVVVDEHRHVLSFLKATHINIDRQRQDALVVADEWDGRRMEWTMSEMDDE